MEEEPLILLCLSSWETKDLVLSALEPMGYRWMSWHRDKEVSPDLIILDVPWARRFGREVLSLKGRAEAFLPVLVIMEGEGPAEPWFKMGFDECLGMPFAQEELKGRVRTLLHIRAQCLELRRRCEAACSMYRVLFEHTGTAIVMADENKNILMANGECENVLGYPPHELVGTNWTRYVASESLEMMLDYWSRRLGGEDVPRRYEARLIRKDGQVIDCLFDVGLDPDSNRVIASFVDITDQKEKERTLKRALRNWQTTFNAVNSVVWLLDRNQRIVNANRATEGLFGVCPGEVVGRYCWEVVHDSQENIPPECPARKAMVTHSREREEMFFGDRWFEVVVDPVLDEGGGVEGLVHIVSDITERKAVMSQLHFLSTAIEQAGEAVVVTDGKGVIQYVNPAFERITGFPRREAIGQNPRILKSGEHDEAFYKNLWETVTRGETWYGRFVNRRKDGTFYIEDATISPVRDSEGNITNFVAIKKDITEHVKLHERQQELEKQLQMAQKMEAVGRLAGGIAHDFNNMLNVILGYGDILCGGLPEGDPHREYARQIVDAAHRSASLVRELLAFSRKQPLQPVVLNLNDLLKTLEKMLSRVIGEDIRLEFILANDLWPVRVDPVQMEQVVMNLVVNARDAMPQGGSLTIETANVELDNVYALTHVSVRPGPYVMLAVTDTGCGMDKETMARVFEPFFTTKERGIGTGLGLSTVYGIVKQSGGYIWVYSEPGKGSTFKVYLPRTEEAPTWKPRDAESREKISVEGKRVLVVEDEEALRELFRETLVQFGFEVTVASNGKEALALVKRGLRPHVVVTDVVMPGMSGKEMVEELGKVLPGIKVLYMSGYTDNAIVHHGVLDPGEPYIQKPFALGDLVAKIKELFKGE